MPSRAGPRFSDSRGTKAMRLYVARATICNNVVTELFVPESRLNNFIDDENKALNNTRELTRATSSLNADIAVCFHYKTAFLMRYCPQNAYTWNFMSVS